MSEKSVKQHTMDVVREVIRQKEVMEMADILYLLPDLMDCVEFDQEYIRSRVSSLLSRKTANPINALLGLLGLRIVNINKTIEGCLDDEGVVEVGDVLVENGSQNMLTVEHKRVRKLVEQIAEALKGAEDEKNDRITRHGDQVSSLVEKLNAMEKRYNQLLIDHEAMCKEALTTAQSMLSKAKAKKDEFAEKQAAELLEDFDAQAFWNAESAVYSEKEMFNIYVFDDPAALPEKPCIVGKNGILLKGVKYIAKEA